MAVGAVLAAALTNHAPRSKLLTIGGVDVVFQPGSTGNGYGVPIETVEVIESGPGGVSSMAAVTSDPAIALLLTDGQDVRFHDLVNDVPIFTGWLQGWGYVPDFGQQGRKVAFRAVGPEILLDWALVPPSLTIAAGTDLVTAIQMAVAASVGAGPLRAYALPGSLSTQAGPIQTLNVSTQVVTDTLVLTGTLREVLRQITSYSTGGGHGFTYGGLNLTVDMTYGLRVWTPFGTGRPADWSNLSINDAPAGPIVAEGLSHDVDAMGIVRGVYITGGNAAGSGLVTDGSGKLGPIAQLTDSTILTSSARDVAGQAYLNGFATGERGSFALTDFAPDLTVHAGVSVSVGDARIAPASGSYPIAQIKKTFQPVRQTWEISYGGLPPSLTRALRRLTRTSLA
jgi:hypothetical protein